MRRQLFAALVVCVAVATPAAAWNWEIVSDFDVTDDLDGWTYPYLGIGNGTVTWQGVAGDGYMQLSDRDGGWQQYIGAPGTFLGNWNEMRAEQISFDFRTDSGVSSPAYAYDLDLAVVSGTSSNPLADIWYWASDGQPGFPPAVDQWTTYTVPLDDTVWRRETGTKTLSQTLDNVTGFVIEAGTNSSSFTNDFDNIKLQGTPELPPSALLGLSMLPLGLAYLRGRRRTGS